MRKVQLYLTEEQYRFLKQRAASRTSLAEVVRQLVAEAIHPTRPESDPFFRHLMVKRAGSGRPYDAEQAKRDLYRKPR
jgi:hypothetical protein